MNKAQAACCIQETTHAVREIKVCRRRKQISSPRRIGLNQDGLERRKIGKARGLKGGRREATAHIQNAA